MAVIPAKAETPSAADPPVCVGEDPDPVRVPDAEAPLPPVGEEPEAVELRAAAEEKSWAAE